MLFHLKIQPKFINHDPNAIKTPYLRLVSEMTNSNPKTTQRIWVLLYLALISQHPQRRKQHTIAREYIVLMHKISASQLLQLLEEMAVDRNIQFRFLIKFLFAQVLKNAAHTTASAPS